MSLFLDDGLRRARPGNRRAVTRPWGLYPCADGFVSFLVLQPAHWRAMAEWIAEETGMDAVLDDVFNDIHVRWEVVGLHRRLHRAAHAAAHEARPVRRGPAAGHPDTPVNTVADLRNDPHLRSAGFWRDDEHPVLGTAAGARARRSGSTTTGGTGRRRPSLGADTADVLAPA